MNALFETAVLMVCYQQAAFIEEALRSVLNQTYQNFRIVAVDDGSNDGTFEILEDYSRRFPEKITVFTHPGRMNRGIAESYRLALSKSSGIFTAFLEGDDVWEKINLEKKICALKSEPAAGVAFSSYKVFGSGRASFYWKLHRAVNLLPLSAKKVFDNSKTLLTRNNVSSFSNFVTRRELLTGFALPETHGDRLDWWVLAHLSVGSGFYFISERLCARRVHGKSVTSVKWNKEEMARLERFLSELRESLGAETQNGWEKTVYAFRFTAHCFLKNLFVPCPCRAPSK